jgi:hypothetical protein
MSVKQASAAFIVFPLLALLTAAAWWCITTHKQVSHVLQMMYEQERHLQSTMLAEAVKRSIENYCATHLQETEEALATTGTLEAQVTVHAYQRKLQFSCVVTKQKTFVVSVTECPKR